jgi:hypothetical protein
MREFFSGITDAATSLSVVALVLLNLGFVPLDQSQQRAEAIPFPLAICPASLVNCVGASPTCGVQVADNSITGFHPDRCIIAAPQNYGASCLGCCALCVGFDGCTGVVASDGVTYCYCQDICR